MFSTAQTQAKDYCAFLSASPSPYHAAQTLAERLEKLGFQSVYEGAAWPKQPGCYYFIREGAVLAWSVPADLKPADLEFRIVGAHTDSPSFKLKPFPGSSQTADGWDQLEVEVYGGMLANSWLDRDLGIAGRVITADQQIHLLRTPALARIPQLAIHLDRQIDRDGLHLDRQEHLHPIWGFGGTRNIYEYLADFISGAQIVAGDLFLYDTAGPNLIGPDRNLVAGARQDNLSSVHAALMALQRLLSPTASGDLDSIDLNPATSSSAQTNASVVSATGDLRLSDLTGTGLSQQAVTVLAAFDHEEIGSATRAGAAGPVLEDLLVRTATALGADAEQYRAALARSFCISADAGHWVHPNYANRHDPHYHPMPGGGPLLKINANQRYATEAVGTARWAECCRKAGVKYQNFVSNNSSPCGSTIGPITATRLGIPTVDVGVGLLGMHSVRELSQIDDNYALAGALAAFWAN